VATPLNGIAGEEAAVVRQVSVHHQRGTKLSFLGGRKKSIDQRMDGGEQANGMHEAPSPQGSRSGHSHKRSTSKDGNQHRQSFFRSHSGDVNGERRGSSPSGKGSSGDRRNSLDERNPEEKKSLGAGLMKRGGSVRKRLSMLKLGMKGKSGNDMMGSLDEE
jgi:hypothetical protein